MATTTKTAAKAKAPKTEQKAEAKTTSENVFENFFANGSQEAKAQFEKANISVEEITEFQRENVEAIVETATLAQKSFEAITAESVTFTQKSYEDSVAVAKKALASTNVQEAIELQTEFAKTAVEAYLGHMKKIGEMFQVSAKEVAAPLNNRVNVAVETAQNASA